MATQDLHDPRGHRRVDLVDQPIHRSAAEADAQLELRSQDRQASLDIIETQSFDHVRFELADLPARDSRLRTQLLLPETGALPEPSVDAPDPAVQHEARLGMAGYRRLGPSLSRHSYRLVSVTRLSGGSETLNSPRPPSTAKQRAQHELAWTA